MIECTLMHKNTPVVDVLMDGAFGFIREAGTLHNQAHLPVGTIKLSGPDEGKLNLMSLNDWWEGRSISSRRFKRIRYVPYSIDLGLFTPTSLSIKCFGLSLSDHYWICPKDSHFTWGGLNFYDNAFSSDVADLLCGHEPADISNVNMVSPDSTTMGSSTKKWIIRDGKRYLMKGGEGVLRQEPLNEVIASAIMRRLNILHAEYALTFDGVLCENFTSPEIELVHAYQLAQTIEWDNDASRYDNLLRCCEEAQIPDLKIALDKMQTVDYIISNEQRHFNNFGFLRQSETLEWIGLAPLYDSGMSLWHNTFDIGSEKRSRLFAGPYSEHIKTVRNLEWFELSALDGIKDECEDILANSFGINAERRTAIAHAIWERAIKVEQIKQCT